MALPLKEIPGDYGVPYFGAVKDRLDYFWIEGEQKFYETRVAKYNSTVFRCNMPPGPPIASDARVICLLDQKSFPILFDVSKVEKRDVFVGTYMPSTMFTGGYRVCAYLDPSEERHTKLKQFCFDILRMNGPKFFPEFDKAIGESFTIWEDAIAKGQKANFSDECVQFAFNFLFRAVVHRDPVAPGEASLGKNGGADASTWTAPQLLPIAGGTGLPHPVEEIVHTIPIPSFLVQSKYDAIYKFIKTYATEALDHAETLGLDRDEACANLLFFLSFNGYGGFNIFFPELIGFISQAGASLQKELSEEVKSAVAANGGILDMKTIQTMALVKSVVYEAFRLKPPVPYQYAKAKTDLIIESHDASFQVKKGEMLFGFQPFVTKDPKVFDNPDTFVPKRFMGPEGEKMLAHVFWSNGPETENPTVHNKQCPGKQLVVTMSLAFVAEMFNRYQEFTLSVEGSGVSKKLMFTDLKKY